MNVCLDYEWGKCLDIYRQRRETVEDHWGMIAKGIQHKLTVNAGDRGSNKS